MINNSTSLYEYDILFKHFRGIGIYYDNEHPFGYHIK